MRFVSRLPEANAMTTERNDESGFTLVELMVTLGLAALLIGGTLGLLAKTLPDWRLRQATNEVASSLQAARARAVLDQSETVMSFDVNRGMYTLVSSSTGASRTNYDSGSSSWLVELPAGISFARPTTGEAVTMSPPGALSDEAAEFDETGILQSDTRPGDVYLGIPSKGLYRRVRVMLAGTISIERWDGSAWRKR